MKPKVILFGASKAGMVTFETLSGQVRVVAFADNDKKKKGVLFCGLRVIGPDDLINMEFDGIIISSMYVEEIYQQLISMGIPSSKIYCQWTEIRDSRPVFPWDAIFFIVFIFVGALGLFVLVMRTL